MRTIFKIGMTVYDRVVFPNMEGKVVDINVCSSFPVKVRREDGSDFSYTADGRYHKDIEPTLSTKPYTFENFEQEKSSAPSYEDVLEIARDKGGYYYLPKDLPVPSKELADATMALLKLLFLRDYYNKGWQPDLKNKKRRGVSVVLDSEGNFFVWGVLKETETHALVFEDEKVAKRFIEEQRELLEIAKPLL